MNKQQITTKQLALCSVLLTLMLVLGWVESLFPPLLGVPGIKLGLSNGVLIFAVYMLSLPTAWVLMLLKVVLSEDAAAAELSAEDVSDETSLSP